MLGLRFTAVFSDAFSDSKRQAMQAFGAEVLVEPSDAGAITPELIQRMKRRALALADEPASHYADQFGSPDVRRGYEPMGHEIADALDGDVSVLVAAVGFEPPFLDRSQLADIRAIDQDEAFAMCRRLARELGVFCGASTGMNVVAAIELARETGSGHRVVTLGCDNGSKYLGGQLYAVD